MGDKKMTAGDVIVVGFTMFAVFFGAGNLIFPPYLGMTAGGEWFIGFLCFILADAGLAVMTVMSMMTGDGTVSAVLHRLGRVPAAVLGITVMACVGPLICVPRTAATTYEMGALPLMPGMNSWVFSAVFFIIVYLLTVRPSKVVDVIGKLLTPMMIVTLLVLFVKGVVTPIGDIRPEPLVDGVAKEGFLAGYQTMDVFGALAITLVLVGNITERGYSTNKSRRALMWRAGLVASAGLFLVYGGLTYLGATASALELGDINQTGLVVLVTELLLKKFGVVLLALIVMFACMTTAIGLVSSAAEFFGDVFRGKFDYKTLVLVMCLFGMVISNVGITSIINIATPVLNIVYPILLTQIFLTFFGKVIKNDNVFKGAALGTLIVCVMGVAADFGLPFGFIHKLPLSSLGFYWLLPAAAGGLLGCLIPDKKK